MIALRTSSAAFFRGGKLKEKPLNKAAAFKLFKIHIGNFLFQ
jgi:hypothetical protein